MTFLGEACHVRLGSRSIGCACPRVDGNVQMPVSLDLRHCTMWVNAPGAVGSSSIDLLLGSLDVKVRWPCGCHLARAHHTHCSPHARDRFAEAGVQCRPDEGFTPQDVASTTVANAAYSQISVRSHEHGPLCRRDQG